tara:strand:+ start:109335 stop:110939 length:1605 start_codon:yes stop_codon:yes gene_type:complete
MLKNLFISLLLIISANCKSTEPADVRSAPAEYTFVTYNVENLFDADGIAKYSDYNTTDREGNPLYTKEDVLTKIQHAIQVLKEYNDGKGPDILALVELESDFSPTKDDYADAGDFLGQYAHTTLEKMLTTEFDEKVKDLPSEWLLLKGMIDSGMWNYQVEVGYPPMENGEPTTVQKTAVFSRFPVLREKTRIHPLERARPILEAHIDVHGNELVVFANHWKSGAGSAEMEEVRLQNAQVLRDRLDILLAENPQIDFVLAGDFNSDYNQSTRYDFPKTAINDVLGSSGDKLCFTGKALSFETSNGQKMPEKCDDVNVYNLWYNYPINERGSDTYRGYWGTLMQIMISPGMYDLTGIRYVEDSFDKGDFEFNTFSSSGEPKRWSSTFVGSGYSDHLPVSMKFKVIEEEDKREELNAFIMSNMTITSGDDDQWKPNPVEYHLPTMYKTEQDFTEVDPTVTPEFFNEYFYLKANVTKDYDFVVNGSTYDVYAPSFRLNEVLGEVAGTDTEIKFYGRFSQYRGNWQFVVESPEFIEIQE